MLDNKKESIFLDKKYIYEFMDLINDNNMFLHKPELISLYNLICTFKDRVVTVVDYLNSHDNKPETEEDFINYFVYASMLYDGFNKMHENLMHQVPKYKEKKYYFKDVKHYNKSYFTDKTCPTDDKFFEYLRAMIFAHPYDVSYRGRSFLEKNEKNYCPFVVVNNNLIFNGINDAVGIRIYTNLDQKSIVDLTFSFNSLKGYLKSIYETFPEFIRWANDLINNQNEEWKQIKVNRNQNNISILNNIKEILESRFIDTYTLDDVLSYLTCKTTIASNNVNVNIFRDKIKEKIPELCDCIDRLDYVGMEETLSLIYERPNKMHQMAYYQLEKIYSYLDTRSEVIDKASNEYWGLKQAYDFSKEFAKKWVKIDIKTMQYDEIKLLVAVACYLESQEQKKQGGK
ncbi:MAG: hypothetical protein V8R16_07200 [Bacilli bacterium]